MKSYIVTDVVSVSVTVPAGYLESSRVISTECVPTRETSVHYTVAWLDSKVMHSATFDVEARVIVVDPQMELVEDVP